MKTITIKLKWHKATDSFACTSAQLKFIESLRNKENCPDWDWYFRSTSNAMRQLTKNDASKIIEALKDGNIVEFE